MKGTRNTEDIYNIIIDLMDCPAQWRFVRRDGKIGKIKIKADKNEVMRKVYERLVVPERRAEWDRRKD